MRGIQLTDYDLAVKTVRDGYGRITSGLIVGDILYQNQAVILTTRQGELKENASVGVGISDMLLEQDLSAAQKEIRQQLELDGQTVSSVTVTETKIEINANYNR